MGRYKLSKKRLSEVRNAVKQMGVDAAAELLGLSRETVRRYCRKGGHVDGGGGSPDVVTKNQLLAKIAEKYSEKELKLIAQGGMPMEMRHQAVHDFGGEEITIGYMGDIHIGSVYTDYAYLKDARKAFKANKVDMVVITGDVTEGMSNRPGHIYECTELGYDAQKKKSIELLKPFDFCPVKMIDGNHDRWYIKSAGAHIVKDICAELGENFEFLGHDEGDILINGVVKVKLWHGEDASSYAISYRLQKLIESFSGGEKPHVLFAGHVHKDGQFLIRNVHCISTGSIQKQSKWMRGKRISAHTGFGVVRMVVNESGVGTLTRTFYPFYA